MVLLTTVFILVLTAIVFAAEQAHFNDGDVVSIHTSAGDDFGGRALAQWNLSSLQNTTFHSAYHPLKEINRFMKDLATLHPRSVKRIKLGHSAQGREMYGLRIRKERPPKGQAEVAKKKFGFMILGAQHAREWVGSAAALYLAHALVADPSEHGSLAKLLDNFVFHIIPAPNPDGYVYTWKKDRLWYKNRMRTNPGKSCKGLDMNRNWGYEFDASTTMDVNTTEALSPDPCGPVYPGHRPFEAPEVNNIANYVMKTRLKGFVDLRSYGQMISIPFSYSCDALPADAEDLLEAALGAAHAIKKDHGTTYMTGRLCSTLYKAPGNILDWMYGDARVKHSYAVHLRDTGTYGYLLPAKWIREVGEETGTLIDYFSSFILRPYKRGRRVLEEDEDLVDWDEWDDAMDDDDDEMTDD